jgi:hypothetical protein
VNELLNENVGRTREVVNTNGLCMKICAYVDRDVCAAGQFLINLL